MAITVFFSWQIDRRNGGERRLIERALKDALSRVQSDATIEAAIREEGFEVDRDTKGVPGQPPIVETIFAKIDRAAIFVPDLTFVATRADGRPSPNPNVLIEYGWALKALSHARMMPVMNTRYGEPTAETMPFDMRHLRHPIRFNLPPDADPAQRRQAGDGLSKDLEFAIRTIIASPEFSERLPKPTTFPAAETAARASALSSSRHATGNDLSALCESLGKRLSGRRSCGVAPVDTDDECWPNLEHTQLEGSRDPTEQIPHAIGCDRLTRKLGLCPW